MSEIGPADRSKHIESFQGREKPFIVISLVRTGRKLGFITSGQRLHVALTRARRGLVVMGNFFKLYNGSDPEGYLWDFVDSMFKTYLFIPTEDGFEPWQPREEDLRRISHSSARTERGKKKSKHVRRTSHG